MPLRPPVSAQDHLEGNSDAILELVEYGDYQCPHCGNAYSVVKRMQQELGEQLKFIFRNFPLAKIHPEATQAAIATEAASLQDKFWEMHDIIFENQEDLSYESLLAYAASIDLDVDQFIKDMQRPELAEKVENDFESGIRSGVNATPTFFINGEKYNEGWESDRMNNFIKRNFPEVKF